MLFISRIFPWPSLFSLLGFVSAFSAFLFLLTARLSICSTLVYGFVVIAAFIVYVLGHVSSVKSLRRYFYLNGAGKFSRFVPARLVAVAVLVFVVQSSFIFVVCFASIPSYAALFLVFCLGKLFVVVRYPRVLQLGASVLKLL